MSPVLVTLRSLPPITLAERDEVRRLRDTERRSWAFIASTMRRREETLRRWYLKDSAQADLATVKETRDVKRIPTRACATCGTAFKPSDSRPEPIGRFCSRSCRGQDTSERARAERAELTTRLVGLRTA